MVPFMNLEVCSDVERSHRPRFLPLDCKDGQRLIAAHFLDFKYTAVNMFHSKIRNDELDQAN
jgi:hypothetical protein